MTSTGESIGMKPYVEKQLRHIAESNGFVDYKLTTGVASKHGDGFTASLERVVIVGKDKVSGEEKTLKLICKLLSDSESRRRLFSLQRAYEREVYVYNVLIPELVKFQQEKGLSVSDGFYEFPKCHYAISDDATNEHLIVLDDLCSQGYEMWDKFKDIPYEKVRSVFGLLGRFHGVSYAIKDQRPDVYAKHLEQMPELMLHMVDHAPGFVELFDTNIEQAVPLFAEGSNQRNYLENLRKTWCAKWRTILAPGTSKFEIFSHGDFWTNNMMFKDNARSSMSVVNFIDWQLTRCVTPIIDLTHYIFNSLKKPFRDQHLDELLHHYHDSLSNAISKCGSSPEIFTYDDLIGEFKRFSTFSMSMSVIMLKIIISDPGQITELESMAEEPKDAETGVAKEFITLTNKTEDVYKQRLTDTLNDAAESEWIRWTD